MIFDKFLNHSLRTKPIIYKLLLQLSQLYYRVDWKFLFDLYKIEESCH